MAIEGSYKSRTYEQDDIDLGFLVASIGGVKLLESLNKAGVLPSKDYVQKNKSLFQMENFNYEQIHDSIY